MEHDLQPVHVNGAHRPKVYFEEWPEPLITGDRLVSELIERAGGTDISPNCERKESRGAHRRARRSPRPRTRNHLRFLVRQAGGNGGHHVPARLGKNSRRAAPDA